MCSSIVERIRTLMTNVSICKHKLSAYIIFSQDGHQSEYTAECDKRREFISKFTGSAGTVVITLTHCFLWTDGRYHIQAENELNSDWTLMRLGLPGVLDMEAWLSQSLPTGATVGTDPLFLGYSDWKRLSCLLSKTGKNLIPVETNLVDIVWRDFQMPRRIQSKIYLHPYSGTDAKTKLDAIQHDLIESRKECLFVHQLDSIAWLLNLRGADVIHTPLFFAYAYIFPKAVELFLNVPDSFEEIYSLLSSQNLTKNDVRIHHYDEVRDFSKRLSTKVGNITVSENCPAVFAMDFDEDLVRIEQCPITMSKAIKNKTELEGLREACIRDSAVLCRFFAYINNEIGSGNLSEKSAAEMLLRYRKEMPNFVDLSFQTISTVGANCAIMHYDVFKSKVDVILDEKKWYHCDSGAQYKDGTTDIARTVCFSTVSDYEMECYTLVIMALIKLSMAVFPEGMKGHSLDALARSPLWSLGLDYLHGTGHGIGSFLNVHEGPQKISYFCETDSGIYEGMVLSNEPGFYENGKFGIHLENMMVVTECKTKYQFNNARYLNFETVSFVPFMTSLLKKEMLSTVEVEWLNQYHAACREKVSPVLVEYGWQEALEWLKKTTSPI